VSFVRKGGEIKEVVSEVHVETDILLFSGLIEDEFILGSNDFLG
jgi:hypothetical protein